MKKLTMVLVLLSAQLSFAGDVEERMIGSEKLQNAILKILRASSNVDASFGNVCGHEDGACIISLRNVVCERFPAGVRDHCRAVYNAGFEEEVDERKISTQRLNLGPVKSIRLANDVMEVLEDNGVESTPTGLFGAGDRFEVDFIRCDFEAEKHSDGQVFPTNVYCTAE